MPAIRYSDLHFISTVCRHAVDSLKAANLPNTAARAERVAEEYQALSIAHSYNVCAQLDCYEAIAEAMGIDAYTVPALRVDYSYS